MIQQTVVIKSNKYGITLCLDKDIAFRDLLSQIAEKFKASAKFFGDAQENTSLEILCIMEQDTLTEAYMKEVLEDRKKELSASDGKFYKGTLRSGQVLEAGSSIIILGDVNPGATVVSKGNVVVLGTLKGTIHAGAAGNEGAFVAALNMNPMQIRIADAIARAADDKPDKKSRKAKETSTGPMIAYTEDGNIYMEPITKEVINDIRI